MQTVEIYTSPLCGYCHAAKRLLTQKGVTFTEVDVLSNPDRKPEMIQRANGGRTVPRFLSAKPMSADVTSFMRWTRRASLTLCCKADGR